MRPRRLRAVRGPAFSSFGPSLLGCGLGPSLSFGSVTGDLVQKLSDHATNKVRSFHILLQKSFRIGIGRFGDGVEL